MNKINEGQEAKTRSQKIKQRQTNQTRVVEVVVSRPCPPDSATDDTTTAKKKLQEEEQNKKRQQPQTRHPPRQTKLPA